VGKSQTASLATVAFFRLRFVRRDQGHEESGALRARVCWLKEDIVRLVETASTTRAKARERLGEGDALAFSFDSPAVWTGGLSSLWWVPGKNDAQD